jgi:hypothetical protein
MTIYRRQKVYGVRQISLATAPARKLGLLKYTTFTQADLDLEMSEFRKDDHHTNYSLLLLESLCAFKLNMHAEEPYLLFDYLGFNHRCVDALKRIRSALNPHVSVDLNIVAPDPHLAELVYIIARAAMTDETKDDQETARSSSWNGIPSCRCSQGLFGKNGADKEVKAIKMFSKNKDIYRCK